MPRDTRSAVPDGLEVPELPGMPARESVARNGTAHGSTEEVGDTWDLTRLRLAQDFSSERGTKVLTRVAVRRPGRQEYVRVRGGEDWRLTTLVLRHEESRELYLVDPSLRASLSLEVKPVTLFTAITRSNTVFLWPCALPNEQRPNLWHQTAFDAALRAIEDWIRLTPDLDAGQYDLFVAEYNFDPEWPDLTFQDLLKLAFKERFMRSLDHPVVQQLHGLR